MRGQRELKVGEVAVGQGGASPYACSLIGLDWTDVHSLCGLMGYLGAHTHTTTILARNWQPPSTGDKRWWCMIISSRLTLERVTRAPRAPLAH